MLRVRSAVAALAAVLTLTLPACLAADVEPRPQGAIQLTEIGRYESGVFDDGAAEIVAYDAGSQRLFVVNAAAATVDVLDITDPTNPTRVANLDVSAFGASANSVAVSDGLVAVAVEAEDGTAAGRLAFFSADGTARGSVEVGVLPDMVAFTPDGRRVLVANEGEPADDYCSGDPAQDPVGSVSVVDVTALRTDGGTLDQTAVSTATFDAFEGNLPAGVRIFGPGASVAQDLEPEYVAVSADGATAWVSLQENNALAVVDVESATVTAIVPLGTKNHRRPEYALDASNRDGTIAIRPWPVEGYFMPDSIAAYEVAGQTFVLTANEGDSRDYDCYSEEERVEDVELAPEVFGNANLQDEARLGRLKITTAQGDPDQDGQFETLYSYGGRSFSVWSAEGDLLWDSGRDFETITAATLGDGFNATNDENGFDDRSDDKGPEPEAITVGRFRGRAYAFIGLERVGGIMVYDVSNPRAPFFVTYANGRDFSTDVDGNDPGATGDLGPEGLVFIPQGDSPIGRALLVVSSEVSGTVTVYSVTPHPLD